MKAALLSLALALALCACEHADPANKAPPTPPPTPPTPTKPDPIQQARDEFEQLPDAYSVGTHKLYGLGELMPDAGPDVQFDEGDFVGRLRTLFGAREGDNYVLRHKKTGYVLTAYSGSSGPSFGGGARYPGALPPPDEKALLQASLQTGLDPAAEARKKADPVLAKGDPYTQGSPDHPVDLHAMNVYMKHLDDAEAGPELAAAVERLHTLMRAVPPADWERTYFYEDDPAVVHVGAKHGESFSEELAPADAFAYLAKQADAADPNARDENGSIDAWPETNLLLYYSAHAQDLAAEKPRALVAYRHFLVAAKTQPADMRGEMLEEARGFAKDLGVRAP